jgi:diguanylate cyclase (GGDEF)-like protein/PAS domain S-box-containing protein
MNDEFKTKKQLIEELSALRRQSAELKRLEIEQRQTTEALRESEEKYRSLVESAEDSMYLVDRRCLYLFMNKRHFARLGMDGDNIMGREYGEFHSPEETAEFSRQIKTVLKTGRSIRQEHKSCRDGRHFLRSLSPVRRSDDKIIAVAVISKDITELKRMEEKSHALSLTDELTGLYNRRGFFAMIEQQLKLCKRMRKGAFMLYMDLDNLKDINDTLGHKEGDNALIDAACILKNNYRESDIIARIGGDEFVVIPVGSVEDDIAKITGRLQKIVDHNNSKNTRHFKLSLSMGAAYYDPMNPCSADELLVRADNSMYEQKKQKRKSKPNIQKFP